MESIVSVRSLLAYLENILGPLLDKVTLTASAHNLLLYAAQQTRALVNQCEAICQARCCGMNPALQISMFPWVIKLAKPNHEEPSVSLAVGTGNMRTYRVGSNSLYLQLSRRTFWKR